MAELKQSLNQFQVVGTLSEINLKVETKEVELKKAGKVVKKVTCKSIEKVDYKNPSLTIEVSRPDGSTTIVGINYFPIREKMLERDSDNIVDNKNFKGFETMLSECVPKETRVRVNGDLGVNEYVGQDGEFKTIPQINAKFPCSSKNVPEEDIAEGKITVVVGRIRQEIKGEDEETGRLFVDCYSFDYYKNAIPHTFVVESDLADEFKDYYKAGCSCKLGYEVISKQVGTKAQPKQSGFARHESNMVSGYTVMEYSIFSGEEKFEEENDYFISRDDVKKAIEQRDIMILNKKNEEKEKDKKPKQGGFGRQPKADDRFMNIPDDLDSELPFN